MEELKNEMVELNLHDLEEAAGGARHFTKQKDRAGWIQHKVGISDTLIKIANRYGVSVANLCQWNGISDPDYIVAGHRLSIYTSR